MLYPIYACIETQLESVRGWSSLDPPLELRSRRRAQLLLADIATLGADAAPSDARRCLAPPDLVVISDFDRALGAAYVLEGSRLGGCVLARQVSVAVGQAAECGLRFLRSDEDDVGRLWKDFLAALRHYAAHSEQHSRDAIIVGALEAFRCFDRHLVRWRADGGP